jgi:vacuolar-type H+-ATPase subunit H
MIDVIIFYVCDNIIVFSLEGIMDLFSTITRAEEETASIIADASRQARDMISSCEEACAQDIKAQEKELRSRYLDKIDERKTQIEAIVNSRSEDNKKEIEKQLTKTEGRLHLAAQSIVDKVLNNGRS